MAVNAILLAVLGWLLFVVVGLVATDLFFVSYMDHPELGGAMAGMGKDYMRIVTMASLGVFMAITLERLLQSTGRSVFSMVSQMAGAITNIILDPILIFGLLGAPAMGVKGAAIATVIGQFVSMGIGILCNARANPDIHIRWRGFRPNLTIIKEIYKVGLPSILMQSVGSVMMFVLNKILVGFGSTPVSVFGIYFKLQSFIFMPVMGFNNGMVPIVAYNFGARKPERISRAVRLGLITTFCIMTVGMLLFWIMPRQLLFLFDASPNMVEIGVPALRIISLSFPIAAVVIIMIGVFQAVRRGMYSFVLSVVRQLVFLIPIAWILSKVSGLPALWFAFPIAEFVSMLLAAYLFRKTWREMILPLKKPAGDAAAPVPEKSAPVEPV